MKLTEKYVFFWSGIYSNWYPCEFEVNGMKFNCSEQYMMYEKAKMFGDKHHMEFIMKTDDPAAQKKAGRLVEGFNAEDWESVCQDIVFEACLAKFQQNEALKTQLLLDGKGRKFVEASPYDKIWGIGMSEGDRGIENPANWKGKNYLGLVLDRVYNELTKTLT